MRVNQYGQVIRSEKEVIDILFQNPNLEISSIDFDNSNVVEKFNSSSRACDIKIKIRKNQDIDIDVTNFDKLYQNQWFIPEEISNFDIETWLYEQCKTEKEFFRVKEELELYHHFKLRQILVISKYLVDTFRKNQLVWGVGRGSSVASYCLYLIGLHKINSLEYNLDVAEFLK